MNCNELDNYLHEFLDDELERETRNEVANHLASCRRCAVKVAAFEQADRGLRSLKAVEPPPDFLAAVRRKIEQEAEAQSPVAPPAAESAWAEWLRRLTLPLWARVSLGGAAAAILVLLAIAVSRQRDEPFHEEIDLAQLEPLPKPSEPPSVVDKEEVGKDLGTARKGDAPEGIDGTAMQPRGPLTPENMPGAEHAVKTPPDPELARGGRAASESDEPPSMVATKAGDVPPRLPMPSAPLSVERLPTTTNGATQIAGAPPLAPTLPAKVSTATLAKLEVPPIASLPPPRQAVWLDLSLQILYPRSETGFATSGFVRGYLDEKHEFSVTSTQVEGPVVEMTPRHAAARGTHGWLYLSSQRFVEARPGLVPSFPYVEGYEDAHGEFHPISRKIHRAGD